MVAAPNAKGENAMTHSLNTLAVCETLDSAWDGDEDVLDLVRTTPLLYDADGLPVGYDAGQLFGLEAAPLVGRV
jgi:hypothetical protein